MIVNGDFSAGNTGFKSDYQFSRRVGAEGSYFVGKDPRESHGGGASFGDHTTGNGLMLIANGSSEPEKTVWMETVKVSPNHKYAFGLWAASWGHWNSGDNDPSPAKLVITINGNPVGPTFPVRAKDGDWSKYSAAWSSGSAKSAVIRIVDQNLEGIGNDFAIDDIVFHR
jgi:hypothetical protein